MATDLYVIRHADYDYVYGEKDRLTYSGQISAVHLSQIINSQKIYESIHIIGYDPRGKRDRILQTASLIATALQQEPEMISLDSITESEKELLEAIKRVVKSSDSDEKNLVLVVLSLDDILSVDASIRYKLLSGDSHFINDSKSRRLIDNRNTVNNLDGFKLTLEDDGTYKPGSAQLNNLFKNTNETIDPSLQQSIEAYHENYKTFYKNYTHFYNKRQYIGEIVKSIKHSIALIEEEKNESRDGKVLDEFTTRVKALTDSIDSTIDPDINELLLDGRLYNAQKDHIDGQTELFKTMNKELLEKIKTLEENIESANTLNDEIYQYISDNEIDDLPF